MGVREDTLSMLQKGFSPKEITKARGVNISTTLGYLDQLIGQGQLRRSDVLFTVPRETWKIINAFGFPGENYRVVNDRIRRSDFHVDPEDVQTVQKYRDARYALGDMYEDIRTIETYLHEIIRETLEEEYGEDLMGWWRQGIPESVRKSCVIRQEEDLEPAQDPYCYTDFLDLWQIIDKRWKILSKVMPSEMTKNKQNLRRDMAYLNTIRRNVMHPVRGIVPSEDDFEFVRDLLRIIVEFNSEG